MAKRTAHPIRPTQPYLNHETLTQDQQAKFLGVKEETVMSLGHPVPISRIADHPLTGQPMNYDTAPQAERQIKEGQRTTQGVYGRHAPINSGVSTADNLRAWSKYSTSNSYDGKDPKGRGEGSDNHLASTKNWSSFEYGSESGLGRIEKAHK
jgi:hypothetical protein